MFTQSTTQKNPPPDITPPARPKTGWRVSEVKALPDFRLQVQFNDGTRGTVNMKGLIHSEHAGVFANLANPAAFAEVFLAYGAVTWPGEIDLAPDAMYHAIKKSGEWVL
jgi:hypothetical protein